MDMQQKAFTVAEADETLRVSEWLVREACRTGQIRSIRLGKRIIIPRDAIDLFLATASDGRADDTVS